MAVILVADDERSICEAFADFVTAEGHEAVVASNGKEAVDAVNSVAAVSEENSASVTEMVSLKDMVAGAVEQFAAYSEQNSAASEQVSASIDSARDQAGHIAEGSREVDGSLQELQSGLGRLKRLT